MPKDVLVRRSDNEWIIPTMALAGRIKRHLQKLVPFRNFIYDYKTADYFVETVDKSLGPQHMSRLGPYYYDHFSGLGRMIGLFRLSNGLNLPPVTCINRHGKEYPEKPLPPELRFNVLTLRRSAMVKELEEYGIKCILPDEASHPSRAPKPITAPVTSEEPNPGLDEYVELTEEQERAMRGY